jgi:hypothetical protein
MIQQYQGDYTYDAKVIGDWNSNAIGVYYCGYINPSNNMLYAHYIGKGTGAGGMRSRLLDHLREDSWPDVTHFGIRLCSTVKEADEFEVTEIARCQPKYNTHHK